MSEGETPAVRGESQSSLATEQREVNMRTVTGRITDQFQLSYCAAFDGNAHDASRLRLKGLLHGK
jgi:hypothetical protein